MNLTEIGRLVKSRRNLLNLKQEDLAEISGVGLNTIHQVENGTGNPTLSKLEKILDVIGLEIKVVIKSL